ncbi:hypothetical protein HN51_016700, partial [Arachis hypogaea]
GIFGRDRATGACAVSGFNAEEHVNEKTEDTAIGFDDSEMSPHSDMDGGPAVQGQASHSEAGASGGSTRRYGRKRKQADILERMADHIQQSSADQRKNAQLLADAIVGVNEKFKVGEKLTHLGFDDEEVVKAILKFAESPNIIRRVVWLTITRTTCTFDLYSDNMHIKFGRTNLTPQVKSVERERTETRDTTSRRWRQWRRKPQVRKRQQIHKPWGATSPTNMNRWRIGDASSSFGLLEVLPVVGKTRGFLHRKGEEKG